MAKAGVDRAARGRGEGAGLRPEAGSSKNGGGIYGDCCRNCRRSGAFRRKPNRSTGSLPRGPLAAGVVALNAAGASPDRAAGAGMAGATAGEAVGGGTAGAAMGEAIRGGTAGAAAGEAVSGGTVGAAGAGAGASGTPGAIAGNAAAAGANGAAINGAAGAGTVEI